MRPLNLILASGCHIDIANIGVIGGIIEILSSYV